MSRDATYGTEQVVQFTIPDAFDDGPGELVIEMRAFDGNGDELALPAEYWSGLIPKLAERVEAVGIDG